MGGAGKETGRSDLQPQTQSKESKVEVRQSYALRKPMPSDILQIALPAGGPSVQIPESSTFLVQTTSDMLFWFYFAAFFFLNKIV